MVDKRGFCAIQYIMNLVIGLEAIRIFWNKLVTECNI